MSESHTALTVTARAALALGTDKARTELAELVLKSANILAVTNAAGREECHGAAMALVKARTTIEKIGKAAREDATAFSKAVIAEEKALVAITAAEESRLLALRNTWDEARTAEKAKAERIERERIVAIHERIAGLRGFAVAAPRCVNSKAVMDLIERLMDDPVEGFDEFEIEAITVRGLTLARMKEISDTKAAEEAERARIAAEQEAERLRLAAERDELARQRKEHAEAQAKMDAETRAERDAQAAEIKRQADELARQRAAFEAEQRAAFEAEQAAELARQRAAFASAAAVIAAVTARDQAELLPVAIEPEPERAPLVLVAEVRRPERPTDVQIVEAVAAAFGVAEVVALSWLIDLDMSPLLDRYEGAVA